jgi:hypothetical protein
MKTARTMLLALAIMAALGTGLTGCSQGSQISFTESPNPTDAFDDENKEPVDAYADYWQHLSDTSIELAFPATDGCGPDQVEKVTQENATVLVTLKESQGMCIQMVPHPPQINYVTIAGVKNVENVEIYSNSAQKLKTLPKR